MKLALIPQPRKLTPRTGTLAVPVDGTLGITDAGFLPAAEEARTVFRRHRIVAALPGASDSLVIRRNGRLRPEGYELRITRRGVAVEAASPAGAFYGVQTLRQIAAQCGGRGLPALEIADWPDLRERGVYLDVARGRVPRLERLIEQVDLLSRHKINQFQLYIEHTFAFRGHPAIGRGASPLTPEDILRLDAFCRQRHVELVPSLATFGHLASVLRHRPYRHLAEDWGVGRYVAPEAANLRSWQRRRGWSLAPANPAIYAFLESLFAEFLPLFTSRRFNVCCDETFDLGLGQSCALCRRRGKGRVYLDHILKLRELAGRYGKRIMFWGDIIRQHPELIPDIPKDVQVLDWGYQHDIRFDKVRGFRRAGVPFLACPGTSSWVSLFPRLHEAAANIHGFAAAARRHGADGLLNTDWGDGGHYNFMEYSWHGYLFGAEQAWNADADRRSFTARFARLFLRDGRPELARAIDALGDVTHTAVDGYYQSIWQHLFFAERDSDLFRPRQRNGWTARGGRIRRTAIVLDARLGRAAQRRLRDIRRVFAAALRSRQADPRGVLPYWLFAVDTLAHAARKLAVLGPGGRPTAAARKRLRMEMETLRRRFERLWLARNRRSEIRLTLARYRRATRSLRDG